MSAARRLAASLFFVLLGGVAVFPVAAHGDEPKPAKTETKGETGEAVVAKESRAEPTVPQGGMPSHVTITDGGRTVTCREQAAQTFLIRGNWFPKTADGEEAKRGRKLLEDAIRYRTEKYGYFEGFGSPKWNTHPPKFYAKTSTFMGMSVQVHEKVIPALKCVEAALAASGAANEYHPHSIGGIRFHNTYRGVEVSNHVYGIAVDIEPDKNTCCGCVAPWNTHPLCKKKVKSVFERMAMPKSWVDLFEKYGFYWLGHDTLADTMHFEFLGDPDKILEPVQ